MFKAQLKTFDDLLGITEKPLLPIAKRLREIVLVLNPNVCEVVRIGDKAATFGVGPKKMTEGYAYILPYKSWVNLGFYKGVFLPDQNNLLQGTGKLMRHLKIHSIEDANKPEIKEFLKLALAERKKALNLA